jgi:hypothetical protein
MRPFPAKVACVTTTVMLVMALLGVPANAKKAKFKAKPKVQATSTTSLTNVDSATSFCDAWAAVRDIRSSGLTGIRAIRLQADRYKILVAVSPPDVKPQAQIMADYFATTLEIADKPVGSEKAAARLEKLIPSIGDAIAAVTRQAVRTCPRSLVVPSTIGAGDTTSATATTTTTTTSVVVQKRTKKK